MPRVLCRPGDILGEGVLWDHRSDTLLWVDILRGIVHSWAPSTGLRDRLQIDAMIGSVALCGEEDLLLATSRGLLRWTAATGLTHLLVNPLAGRPLRFNDGRVDGAGRFWVGTMALDPERYAEPLGALYRYDPDGTFHQMEEGLTLSNGLDWSPDRRTLYLTDTMRRLIYAYDFNVDEGTIGNRRNVVETGESEGFPDGLVVDREGYLWSACFGGGAICRYDLQGQRIQTLKMPVSCPTSITFGGRDYRYAYITTSRHALPADHHEPEAGSLFTLVLPDGGSPASIFGRGGTV